MPIEIQSNTPQFIRGLSMATFDVGTAFAQLPTDWLDIAKSCPSACGTCEDEFAFHDSVGTDNYKNDNVSAIFKKDILTDGYSIKLYKEGTFLGIDITTAIAVMWDWGEISPNDKFSEYAGFQIDWYSVYAAHGNGNYTLKGTITRGGVVYDYESHRFLVRPFSCEIAKDTIKIQAIQNGYIMSESMDFSGFNWYSSKRVNGKLKRLSPKQIVENHLSSGRLIYQNQDETQDSYELDLWPMPTSVKQQIVYHMGKANQIFVSDYNVNEQKFDKLALYVSDIQQVKSWANNPDSRVTLEMKPREQNQVKRNFKNVFTAAALDDGLLIDEGYYILWL